MVISESKGKMAEDALTYKQIYERIKGESAHEQQN